MKFAVNLNKGLAFKKTRSQRFNTIFQTGYVFSCLLAALRTEIQSSFVLLFIITLVSLT